MEKSNDRIRERLSKLDCASLCDASPLVRTLSPGLKPLHPDIHMIGTAHTISCSNDYLTVIRGVSEAAPGDVLVVDGRRQDQAIFGELLAAEACRRKLAGAVVDGAVRDMQGMRQVDFPVYYRWANPRAGRAEVLEPPADVVSICGVTVASGDWIVGDADGVVVIPQTQVGMVLSVAEEIQKVEAKVFDSVRKGTSLTKIMKFEEFRREHEREIRAQLDLSLSGDQEL